MLLASLQLSVGALLPWSWEFVQAGVGMLVSFQRKGCVDECHLSGNKGVNVEVERTLFVFDTGIRYNLNRTVP